MAHARLKKASILILFYCFVILLSGCSSRSAHMFTVLNGVLSWSRGDWPSATASFLESAEIAREEESPLFYKYALYGLASTYLAQNETESATEQLSLIGDDAPAEIRAAAWYQAGIIAFRQGAYDQAVLSFRKSLENDSSSIDAKINLELSQNLFSESLHKQSAANSGVQEGSIDEREAATIFNLVHKKEQNKWKNRESETASQAVVDY